MAVALAGRRAVAVDVQALVVPVDGPPRRQVAGLDGRRFHIVAAITDQALGLRLGRADVYGSSSGAFRLEDPGADLALAAALASAATGRAVPDRSAFVGELSLTGSIRPVPGIEQRASAAAGAGANSLVVPAASGPEAMRAGLRVAAVGHVRDALGWALD